MNVMFASNLFFHIENKETSFLSYVSAFSGLLGIIVTIILFMITFKHLNQREIKKYKNASIMFFSLLIRGFQDCLVFLDRFETLRETNYLDYMINSINETETEPVINVFNELLNEPFCFEKEIFDAFFASDVTIERSFLDDFLDTKVKLTQYQQLLFDKSIQKEIGIKPVSPEEMRKIIKAEILKIKKVEEEYYRKGNDR